MGSLAVLVSLPEPLELRLGPASILPAGRAGAPTPSMHPAASSSVNNQTTAPSSSAAGEAAFQATPHEVADERPASEASETIHHLPPIILRFQVPKGYPASECIAFAINCIWLFHQQQTAVASHLRGLWEDDHDVVLFRFSEFLSQDLLGFLGLVRSDKIHHHRPALPSNPSNTHSPESLQQSHKPPHSSRPWLDISLQIPNRHSVIEKIIRNDQLEKQKEFDESRFDCSICLESKRGRECFRFPVCLHVFCQECLVDYFTVLIQEGSVSTVGCLNSECKKKLADAISEASGTVRPAPSIKRGDLEQLGLDEDVIDRWEQLTIRRTLEGRPDVTYCPRPICQAPVIRESLESKLCICKECQYTFCFFCDKLWHGDKSFCKSSNIEMLAREYMSDTITETRKRGLEQRYGKKALEFIVDRLRSDELAKEWIQNHGQVCPQCDLLIEKSDGCNHMTCSHCSAHFCYLCGAYIDKRLGYVHFNDPKSTCFLKLFADIEGRNHEDDDGHDNDDDPELDEDYEPDGEGGMMLPDVDVMGFPNDMMMRLALGD